MRKGRLFQVVCHLLERGQSTAADMAREFGVSVRTVYRDVETLNAAGIPIYAETGRSGGICLMKGFVLDRAMLSKEERGEILAAVRDMGELSSPDSLQKLSELFRLPDRDWLELELSPEEESRFNLLRRAIAQHHLADITYAGPGGQPEKLSVMPIRLCCRPEGWYLKARCAGEYRLLALSRMIKWKPSVNTFEPRDFPEDKPAPGPETSRVILRFPAEIADSVYEAFDGSLITLRKDGALELRQDIPVNERLIGRLLALGPKVRVSAPAALKKELARRAEELYEAYK